MDTKVDKLISGALAIEAEEAKDAVLEKLECEEA